MTTIERLKNNVEQLRKAKGLTQYALGELADVTGSTVSLIERGQSLHVPISTIEKLALALEVSPQDLLYKEFKLWIKEEKRQTKKKQGPFAELLDGFLVKGQANE